MSSSPRPGAVLSGLGALLLGGALWLPWYAVHVPETLGRQLGGSGEVPPLLGQLVREIAAAIPADLTVTAWQAFDVADVLLAVGCAHVLFAAVFGAASPDAARKLTLAVGVAAAALVVLKLASPPGPDGLLEVRYGAWVALGGALLVALGGVLDARDTPASAPLAAPFPAPSAPPTDDAPLPPGAPESVAPPGR
jgi:hypothetical protein